MQNYKVGDLVGKTLAVKNGTVKYYKFAARKGEKKDAPLGELSTGDIFTVYSYLNQNGKYTKFDDNYYQIKNPDGTFIYIPFKEMQGKYDASYVKAQGVKSIEQKQQEQQEKEDGVLLTLVKKYVPILIGGALLIGFVSRRK